MTPEPEPSKHLELGQQTDSNSVSSQMKVENETVVKDTKDESTVSNREEVPLEDENIKEKEVVIGNENSKASVTEAENVKRQDNETMNGEVQKEDEKSSTASGGDSDKSAVIVESKSVQMPNIDPMLNKKIKKKDKSSKEEEKLGNTFSVMAEEANSNGRFCLWCLSSIVFRVFVYTASTSHFHCLFGIYLYVVYRLYLVRV